MISDRKKAISKKLFQPILKKGVNLRNCYNLEEEIGQVILDYYHEFQAKRHKIEEHEVYQASGAEFLIVAHGIVAAACKSAIDQLRKKGLKIGLFRPITLRPFPAKAAAKIAKKVKKIFIIESALGQLASLFKDELNWLKAPLIEISKPAVGLTPGEINETITSLT